MSSIPVRDFSNRPVMVGKVRMSAVERQVFERDGGKCHYCGCGHSITFDHIVPKSKGGSNSESNLVCACRPCNSSKGTKDYDEFKEWLQAERIAFEMHLVCQVGL